MKGRGSVTEIILTERKGARRLEGGKKAVYVEKRKMGQKVAEESTWGGRKKQNFQTRKGKNNDR